ncbi:rRNA maturation RNase YbeY [Rhodococcus sp. X156]|uniref:rRNA maturation RNase YbeY n=1 Tax=Rhodococcus sp. X156 TaxID=2499145 RepID=UPI000FDA48BE|nr:rRNA maturation RNase YbeY [Rhodococcus sp. X156]
MSIEIANESGVEVDEADLVAVAGFALERMQVHPAAELSMVLVDNASMATLHEQWMDLPGPTDVMSFPMDEMRPGGRPDAADPGPSMLGDIVLCPAFAADQAEQAGKTLAEELRMLTVHGVLHLLGYDHAEPEEKREMFGLQDRLLADFHTDRRRAARQAVLDAADQRLLGTVGLDDDGGRAR